MQASVMHSEKAAGATVELEPFKAKLSGAFETFLLGPDAKTVVAGFREAYEFRKAFPYPVESRPDGLKLAFRRAMSGYPDPKQYQPKLPIVKDAADPGFFENVRSTFKDFVSDDEAVKKFAAQLGKDPNAISVPDLALEIRAGLIDYYRSKRYGLGWDPLG